MSDINDINKIYSCIICNKKYTSNSSLWNHNNKFHKDTVNNNVNIYVNKNINNVNNLNNLNNKINITKKYYM